MLQKTQEGKLTFGHQTLLDALVISRALRQEQTLNDFIQNLSPVPFVRPSIRGFIAQLVMSERSEFRKQLRTVLTGEAAFHIRRLVAESFAEQMPQDSDWSLIRVLYDEHGEVFQVIYTRGVLIEWHYFWFKHLIPFLKDTRDAERLTMHAHLISQWLNEDAVGVLTFWTELLSLDWVECKGLVDRLGYYISKINTENLTLVVPLLEQLLNMPQQERNILGHTVARCVKIVSVSCWIL